MGADRLAFDTALVYLFFLWIVESRTLRLYIYSKHGITCLVPWCPVVLSSLSGGSNWIGVFSSIVERLRMEHSTQVYFTLTHHHDPMMKAKPIGVLAVQRRTSLEGSTPLLSYFTSPPVHDGAPLGLEGYEGLKRKRHASGLSLRGGGGSIIEGAVTPDVVCFPYS